MNEKHQRFIVTLPESWTADELHNVIYQASDIVEKEDIAIDPVTPELSDVLAGAVRNYRRSFGNATRSRDD